ncbi:alpha/beta fold hydrolase [Alicyclobacillus sp. SO9]|uniref:alpha/beta fold hydrolase n=1 Tax=Alicyclobacillus sp. SO9 TaxID=2665646 RepID=UPI0018E74D69|nr:alpha/beta hydrolase [Alicyclobacillus sp. SO9]QQE80163.1 alpha/beta hydrolase [Alicyclobacillus sp. SO9]
MTGLFVEEIGRSSAPPLLYLHGGPGTGSYDFVEYQHKFLADGVRLIAMDQRGVLRSSAIADRDSFGLNHLVEDIEDVRKSLGISSWSVLGHSFGGYLGALYANVYPSSVDKLIFENATFDLGLSARSLLQGVALEYSKLRDTEMVKACLNLAFASTKSVSDLWYEFMSLTNDLGDDRNSLYVHGINRDFFEQLVQQSPFSSDEWGKAAMHQTKLFEEGKVFNSLLGRIPVQPTLLLKGRFDYVMSLDQIQAYIARNSKTELVVFENSAHFPHAEEARAFASEVIRYMNE